MEDNRGKLELPTPPSEPDFLKPGLATWGLTPRPGQMCGSRTGARPPRPGPREAGVMAESRGPGRGWGPGSALRPATPPGVRLLQDGLRGSGEGRTAGADTGAALGDAPLWDGGPWPAPSSLPRRAGRVARCPPRRWGRYGRARLGDATTPLCLRQPPCTPVRHGCRVHASEPVPSAARPSLSARAAAMVSPDPASLTTRSYGRRFPAP